MPKHPLAGVRAASLAIPLLLVTDAALAQFRPLRFDDDFSAQRQQCIGNANDNGSACWKDRPLADRVRLSIRPRGPERTAQLRSRPRLCDQRPLACRRLRGGDALSFISISAQYRF